MRRQENWVKLKPNAVPTLFNVPVKPPVSLQNENVYTDIVNIPVDEPTPLNPNYVKLKIANRGMTNVTAEKPTTANLDVVKWEIADEIEDITVEESTLNHNPNTYCQITDVPFDERTLTTTTTTHTSVIQNEVELPDNTFKSKRKSSTVSVTKPTTRVVQNNRRRCGTKRKRRNNGTFVSSSKTKTLSTTQQVETEEEEEEKLPTAAFTEHLDDNFDTFGKFIASELRSIHSSSSNQVLHRLKKKILNVLFDTWDIIDLPCTSLKTPNLADHEYSVSNFP